MCINAKEQKYRRTEEQKSTVQKHRQDSRGRGFKCKRPKGQKLEVWRAEEQKCRSSEAPLLSGFNFVN